MIARRWAAVSVRADWRLTTGNDLFGIMISSYRATNPSCNYELLCLREGLCGGAGHCRAQGDVNDESIIFSPLLNATFRSLIISAPPVSRVEFFCSRLLDGVGFLHDHGLCHGDIKSVDFLIRSYDPPDALLCDFGRLSNKMEILYYSPGTAVLSHSLHPSKDQDLCTPLQWITGHVDM
jgi:serine/threonine protein kinase